MFDTYVNGGSYDEKRNCDFVCHSFAVGLRL